MSEGQGGGGDRIVTDAEDMAAAARDLAAAREKEISLVDEQRQLDEQIAELQRRRDQVEGERRALHDQEIADERRIADDLRDADGELGGLSGPGGPGGGPGGGGHGSPPSITSYEFYVDSTLYQTDLPHLTGRQIKAKVQAWDQSHDLVLEGAGGDADRIIGDDEEVDLACHASPLHFSSAPRANFG